VNRGVQVCVSCKVEKNINEFSIRLDTGFHRGECRKCINKRTRGYVRYNKQKLMNLISRLLIRLDILKQGTMICYKCGNERPINLFKSKNRVCKRCREGNKHQWYEENKDRLKIKGKEYAERNKEKKKKYHKKYYLKNKSKLIKYIGEYTKKRRKQDINYKILDSLRCRIYGALKGERKSESTKRLLGCSLDYFKKYFASLFTDEMTWDKFLHGEIHIDHIKPCDQFDLTDIEQQRQCFNYKNIQPLWKTTRIINGQEYIGNLNKGKKILYKENLDEKVK
jgi:hypothetical protein